MRLIGEPTLGEKERFTMELLLEMYLNPLV